MLTLLSTLALAATAMGSSGSSSDSPEHELTLKAKIIRHGKITINGFDWEFDVIKKGGLWVFGGDIIIGNEKDGVSLLEQPSSSSDSSSSSSSSRRRLNPFLVNTRARWQSGVVPYVIDSVLCKSSRFMTVFKDVVGRFATKTGIRLVPTPNTATTYDHLRFFQGRGCYSYVGNIGGSRRQDVSIGNGCAHVGIVIHEILHALGFMHTQTREDRDKYVIINLQNVRKGMEHNFNKANVNQYDDCLQYDYSSVMHYGGKAFSTNGQPTIVAKQSGAKLGQRGGFSNLDVACVKKIYPGLKIPAQAAAVKCNGGGSPVTQPVAKPTKQPVVRPVVKPTKQGTCADKYSSCPNWKKAGYCATSSRYYRFMSLNCKKSCNKCSGVSTTTTTSTTTTKSPTKKATCSDKYASSCPRWKKAGYCASSSRYYRFMLANCKKSCNKCSTVITTTTKKPTCSDRQSARNCNYWKSRNFCAKTSRYHAYMKSNCKKTCNLCGVSAHGAPKFMPDFHDNKPKAALEVEVPADIPEGIETPVEIPEEIEIPDTVGNPEYFDIPQSPGFDKNVGNEIFGLQTAVVALVVAVTLLVMYICSLKFKIKNKAKSVDYSHVSVNSDSESETPLKQSVEN